MGQEMQQLYLLLDSRGTPLAQARPQGPNATGGELWQLVVLDDKVDLVLKHKKFRLMAITDSSPSYEGTLVRCRNDIIQLEVRKTAANGNDMRKNLRVPVSVDSFIYPLTGTRRFFRISLPLAAVLRTSSWMISFRLRTSVPS